MKKIFWVFSFLLLASSFIFFAVSSSAMDANSNSTPSLPDVVMSTKDTSGDNLYVDANVLSVDITFNNLGTDQTDFWFCPKSDQNTCKVQKQKLHQTPAKSGTIKTTACGDGEDSLKSIEINGETCRIEKKSKPSQQPDYFHEGFVYRLGLYNDDSANAQINTAGFYVRHSIPYIKITPTNPRGRTKINVTLAGRRPGGTNLNNYQVTLNGTGKQSWYDASRCITTKDNDVTTYNSDHPPNSMDLPNDKWESPETFDASGGLLNEGNYTLQVKERVNDSTVGRAFHKNSCDGGYVYFEIPLTISTGEFQIGKIKYDPDNSDGDNEEKLNSFAPAPCAEADASDPKKCAVVRTAIGDINVTPEGFVKSLFELILMLAGFSGVIIIIYSGYMLMISRGDKEKLAAARETLTGAIVGLLFIVLSIVILEIIGVDILRIPGFGK